MKDRIGLLATSSGTGQTLNGTNAVSIFNATNSTSGNISIWTSLVAPLTVTGISNTGGSVMVNGSGAVIVNGAVTASNAVTLTGSGITNNATIRGNQGVSLNAGIAGMLSNATAASIITNGGGASTGAISLIADKMNLLGGTVTAGAAAVNIGNSSWTNAINLGSTVDTTASTLELSNAELATISTTGLLSIGNVNNAGAITVSAPLTLSSNTALVNGGGIAINGAINATGKNLTLNTAGAATQTAAITAAGLELLTGSFALNSANSIATVAGNAASVSLVDTTALSVGTVNATTGITSTGAITLATPGNITLNAGGIINAGAANVILASTAGNFINNSGSATPITAGITQIWSTGPASNVKGGMVPTASFFACTYLGACAGTPVAGYNFFYTQTTAPVLTITANSLSKYLGTADPALTYTATGLVGGDTGGNVLTGALARAPGQSAGTYAINQGTVSAAAAYGYSVNYVPGLLTIQAPPAITLPVLSELINFTVAPIQTEHKKSEAHVIVDASDFAGLIGHVSRPVLVCQ